MFRLANIFLFFALVTSVFAGAVYKPKQCGKYSTVQQVKVLRTQFRQPAVFCNWYLSHMRLQSPNTKFTTAQITHACECLVNKPASHKHVILKEPYNFERVCKPLQQQVLIKNFKNPKFYNTMGQPKVFCDFWGQAKNIYRPTSPFSNMNNQQIYNACECYYNPAVSSTTSSAGPSSTTSVSSSSSSTMSSSSSTTTTSASTSVSATPTPTQAPTSSSTAGPVVPSTTSSTTTSAMTTAATSTGTPTGTATPTATPTSH